MTLGPLPGLGADWLSDNLRGALWILGSVVAGTVMSVGIKILSPDIHTMQITFLRCFIGLLLVLPFVVPRRAVAVVPKSDMGASGAGWLSPRWPLHLLRGLLATVAINCGYYSLSVIPLATVTVIFFTAPLFITILAVPFLGEKVGWRRWSATATGFVGAVIVLKPTPQSFEPVMLFAVLSSILFAAALIVGKLLSRSETPSTMLLYSGVITTLGSFIPALLVWAQPTVESLLFLVVISVFATARTYFDIKGYAAGEASFVAPFSYARLILMALAGYFLFNEVPQASALLGAAIIIASSLYIAAREARAHHRLSKPVVGPSPD